MKHTETYVTYLLTPWCRVLPEQLTGLQLVKKFPAFHGTRRFITELTSVRHLSLSWASPIQSTRDTVNDLNSWLPFTVNSAVCQLNQWHICCHSSVSSWNLHVLSAFCRYSGKTVGLRHPHIKPWTLIMTFWQVSNEPWSLVINLRWFYVETPLYKYLHDIRQVFVTSPNVFLYTRLPVCNVCAIWTFQMRFLSTFKSQMSVEICFPCVLFMTLGTWKMGVDVWCRCSLRACSNCTLITHKPVLCRVSQKRSDRLCSS